MKKLFLFGTLLLLCSCAPNLFNLDKKTNVRAVGIHLTFDQSVPPEVQTTLANNLDGFVKRYNSESHLLKTFVSDKPDSSSITVYVLETRLVSKGQQWAGTAVSLAGLSLPFVMVASGAQFAIFFYYFPRVNSPAQLTISNDIALTDNTRIGYVFNSPGYLKSRDRQIERHGDLFQRQLNEIFRSMEKSLRK